MPAAAAARSFERTAMNIRPVGELRSRATRQPDQRDDDQHEHAEDHPRVVVALGDPEIPPEQRRRVHAAAAGRR